MNFHAVYTHPRKEFQARDEIHKLGYETFLPIQTRSVIVRRKRRVLTESLFSRYIFLAREASDDSYGAVNHCRGVQYIIENAGAPAIVPNAKIELLKMAEKAGCFDFSKNKSKFQAGDNVEILTGPFTGLIAKVQSASPRKRVKLLMNWLGAEVPVEIDEQDLRAAS